MNSDAYANSIVLQIDEANRAITNNGKNTPIILGVKGDDCAERVYFESPRILSPEINLLPDENEGVSVRVFVNYKNASKEPYIQECTDVAAIANSDTVTFSWLVTNYATNTKGEVLFNVCVKKFDNEGHLTNEWHTTTFTGKILDSIDVTAKTPEVITHDAVTLQALTIQVQNYSIAVSGYANSVNTLTAKYNDVEAVIDAAVNSKMEPYSTTEYVNSTFLTKTEASNTYALKSQMPITSIVLDNLNANIPIWTNVGDTSAMSLALGDLSRAKQGDKLRLYFGQTAIDEYANTSFIIDVDIISTNRGTSGQASHILVSDAFEGILSVKMHGENNYKQMFFSVITKMYNSTYISNVYGSNGLKITLNKIELITGSTI